MVVVEADRAAAKSADFDLEALDFFMLLAITVLELFRGFVVFLLVLLADACNGGGGGGGGVVAVAVLAVGIIVVFVCLLWVMVFYRNDNLYF